MSILYNQVVVHFNPPPFPQPPNIRVKGLCVRFLTFFTRLITTEHRVHRVATSTFWCTFHHDGKICPGWWGWGVGVRPPAFAISTITYKVVVYAPAERADTLPLFLFYTYMYSVPHITPDTEPESKESGSVGRGKKMWLLWRMRSIYT
jgi:hypothetical protein